MRRGPGRAFRTIVPSALPIGRLVTPVPAEIRALVHAKPGTRLVWSAMPDGTLIVRAKTQSILDMAGMLKAPEGKRVKVDDMKPWR